MTAEEFCPEEPQYISSAAKSLETIAEQPTHMEYDYASNKENKAITGNTSENAFWNSRTVEKPRTGPISITPLEEWNSNESINSFH